MSSCVVIEERLDPSVQAGIYDSKLQAKGDYWGDLRKVPCTKGEQHKACDQIFPLLKHPNWRTPTVKHNCPRTVVSASLRACSNKVSSDPILWSHFEEWFKTVYVPKFLKCLEQELVTVDLEEWLKGGRYSLAYQAKLKQALEPERADTGIKQYESFPKIEQQFTTVPHEVKDTPLNDVKERQICGPSDLKKCMGNPFIYQMEGVAHRYFKEYCGRKDWLDICKTIENVYEEIPNVIFGAADGSGFDMSQLKEHNKLMNFLLEACAIHPNVTWREPLTVDLLMKALDASIDLDVSCDRGQLRYHAEGRASGDGWTTFGNTMLMISYWQYVFHLAGITKYFLLVKGDDVLFGFDRNLIGTFKDKVKIVFTERKDQHTHGLAQICKKIEFGDISELDFLSNHFFWTRYGRLRMTRIPARVVQTLSWTTKLPNIQKIDKLEDSRRQLLYSKGSCLLAWGRGLPIWEPLARKMMQIGRPGSLTEYNQYSDQQRVWNGNDDRVDYLVYLQEKFGMTEPEVEEIELAIARVSTADGELFLPSLEKFYS